MEQMISTEMVARFLGVTRPTIIKYIQEGRLNATRSGKAYKIARGDLESFAKTMGVNGARMAELDSMLCQRDKRTRSLNGDTVDPDRLVGHLPPKEMFTEPDVLYYVAVRTHPLAREIIFRVNTCKYFIGRHSLASLSIQDPFVSSLHATLVFDGGLVKILDQSTNGTHVRGQLLKSGDTHTLGDGDQLRVAEVLLTLISANRMDEYMAAAQANE